MHLVPAAAPCIIVTGGGGSPDLRIVISMRCSDLADCDFYLRVTATTGTRLHLRFGHPYDTSMHLAVTVTVMVQP
ncbi:unnamed protein product [Urochloa humidicola]